MLIYTFNKRGIKIKGYINGVLVPEVIKEHEVMGMGTSESTIEGKILHHSLQNMVPNLLDLDRFHVAINLAFRKINLFFHRFQELFSCHIRNLAVPIKILTIIGDPRNLSYKLNSNL